MKIVNEALLQSFREKSICEWCGKTIRSGLDPAHLFSRGAGRIDLSINLAALCRNCHRSQHDGNEPTVMDLLAVVAQREQCNQEDIVAIMMLIRRMPKESKRQDLIDECRWWSNDMKDILTRSLNEMGIE